MARVGEMEGADAKEDAVGDGGGGGSRRTRNNARCENEQFELTCSSVVRGRWARNRRQLLSLIELTVERPCRPESRSTLSVVKAGMMRAMFAKCWSKL